MGLVLGLTGIAARIHLHAVSGGTEGLAFAGRRRNGSPSQQSLNTFVLMDGHLSLTGNVPFQTLHDIVLCRGRQEERKAGKRQKQTFHVIRYLNEWIE